MTQELNNFVSQHCALSQEEITLFTNRFRRKTIRKGEYLLQTGSVCSDLVFVQSGCLRLYYPTEETDVCVWFAFPGTLATELASFISQQPSDFAVQAIEDSQVLYLPKAELTECYKVFPELNQMMRMIWEDVIVNIIYRFTSLQHDTAEQRYIDLLKHPDYLQTVPQKFLASFIGVTPSSLSRIRKNLAKASKLS